MVDIGYYNGKTGPIESMTIPMNDRVVYFGDGVYDATYAVNHILYALEDHLERFYASCEKLEIRFSMQRTELARTLQSLVDEVENSVSLMVYWQTSRGTGVRAHAFPENSQPNLLATVRPVPLTSIERRLKLITLEDTRFFHCDIKTLNLIPSVLASQRAKAAGCDEAVFHRGPLVTECAHSNIHILDQGVFRTSPLTNLILPGTARKHLLKLAEGIGVPTNESAFTLPDLMDADEIIVSSAGTLCNAVTAIDGTPVGGRDPELLKTLQDAAVAEFERYTKASFALYSN